MPGERIYFTGCQSMALSCSRMIQSFLLKGRSFRLIWAVFSLVGCVLLADLPVSADPRSTFPGRRVSAGTRGECMSRVLAHLVPESSVMALSPSRDVAFVLGPSANPVATTVSFKPAAGGQGMNRTFKAEPVGINLLTLDAIEAPIVWQSVFDCASMDSTGSGQSFDIVQTSSPPAISLLLVEKMHSDQALHQLVDKLKTRCGKTVPTRQLLASFGLDDLITPQWPDQLPVRCRI
jgi:hypothetical protein